MIAIIVSYLDRPSLLAFSLTSRDNNDETNKRIWSTVSISLLADDTAQRCSATLRASSRTSSVRSLYIVLPYHLDDHMRLIPSLREVLRALSNLLVLRMVADRTPVPVHTTRSILTSDIPARLKCFSSNAWDDPDCREAFNHFFQSQSDITVFEDDGILFDVNRRVSMSNPWMPPGLLPSLDSYHSANPAAAYCVVHNRPIHTIDITSPLSWSTIASMGRLADVSTVPIRTLRIHISTDGAQLITRLSAYFPHLRSLGITDRNTSSWKETADALALFPELVEFRWWAWNIDGLCDGSVNTDWREPFLSETFHTCSQIHRIVITSTPERGSDRMLDPYADIYVRKTAIVGEEGLEGVAWTCRQGRCRFDRYRTGVYIPSEGSWGITTADCE